MTLLLDNAQNLLYTEKSDYGYQDILFTSAQVGGNSTGLSAAVSYEFRYRFTDSFSLWNSTSFTFGVPPTFNDVITQLNLHFTANSIPALAFMFEGALRIASPKRGTKGIVRLDDIQYVNKLFSDMTVFSSFGTPVDGTPRAAYQEALLTVAHDGGDVALPAGTYTTEFFINGIYNTITITLGAPTTYEDLAAAIGAKLKNGWIEFYRDRFIVRSNAGGFGASVFNTTDGLFLSVTDFSAFGAPVTGTDGTLNLSVLYMGPGSEVREEPFSEAGLVELWAGRGAATGGNLSLYAGNSSLTTGGAGGTLLLQAGSNLAGAGIGGNVEILAGSTDTGTRGDVLIAAGEGLGGSGGHVIFYTNGIERLRFGGNGAWSLAGGGFPGSTGQVITSNGAGTPPTWEYPATPIAGMVTGAPAPSQIVLNFVAPYSFTIPASFTLSQAKAQTASTGTSTFSVQQNGTPIGTITFTTSAIGVYAGAGGTFAAGDILTIVAPVLIDATLADIGFTIVANNWGV